MARETNLKTRKGRKIKRKYKIRNENEVLSAKEKINERRRANPFPLSQSFSTFSGPSPTKLLLNI